MFNGQLLFDRPMHVKMVRTPPFPLTWQCPPDLGGICGSQDRSKSRGGNVWFACCLLNWCNQGRLIQIILLKDRSKLQSRLLSLEISVFNSKFEESGNNFLLSLPALTCWIPFRMNEPSPREISSLQSDPNNSLVSVPCMIQHLLLFIWLFSTWEPVPAPVKLWFTLENWDPNSWIISERGIVKKSCSVIFWILLSAHGQKLVLKHSPSQGFQSSPLQFQDPSAFH